MRHTINRRVSAMRRRPSARLLVLDGANRALLFRFAFTKGALGGQEYWATPGGAVEPGETFAEAARRELLEETGIVVEAVGDPVAEQEFILQLASGERVVAEERFFLVRVADPVPLSRDQWTPGEREVMVEHRWWSASDLSATDEVVFPEDLADILARVGMTTGR
jgi:8-oxo-dGTP pyrophosphatase MutT (NUDIX family)